MGRASKYADEFRRDPVASHRAWVGCRSNASVATELLSHTAWLGASGGSGRRGRTDRLSKADRRELVRVVAWEASARADADPVLTVPKCPAGRDGAPETLAHHANHTGGTRRIELTSRLSGECGERCDAEQATADRTIIKPQNTRPDQPIKHLTTQRGKLRTMNCSRSGSAPSRTRYLWSSP